MAPARCPRCTPTWRESGPADVTGCRLFDDGHHGGRQGQCGQTKAGHHDGPEPPGLMPAIPPSRLVARHDKVPFLPTKTRARRAGMIRQMEAGGARAGHALTRRRRLCCPLRTDRVKRRVGSRHRTSANSAARHSSMTGGRCLPSGRSASTACTEACARDRSTTSLVAGLKADPLARLSGGPSGASADRSVTAIRVQKATRMDARPMPPPSPRLCLPICRICRSVSPVSGQDRERRGRKPVPIPPPIG